MSSKAWSWTLLAVVALVTILLFNYWGAFQPLSTLVYAGIVLAFCGFANILIPFRFLGIRKRVIGLLILIVGIGLALAALHWPASTVRVAQRQTVFDEYMPEYQFYERHSTRVHASREQVMQSVRASTFRDMTSLRPLLRIRSAAMRVPAVDEGIYDRRIFDVFESSGYLPGGNDHEIALFGAGNARTRSIPKLSSLQEFADYREPGGLKIAFDFTVEDAGNGWCTLTTETRVMALDNATRDGMGRYWRLIVPGSGLLRRQWLDGIKRRAEAGKP